ncbi:MAG: DsbA family protein [Candidatus Pacebacteria bacterium]|nr:DsbA family protein [Candidatus Paceibacterota bacterium]
MNMEDKKYTIPAAIVIAGLIIAGALYMVNQPSDTSTGDTERGTVAVPAVSADDHILGNPDAKVVIVEYSDFECPFCKNFHSTMHAIMNEYGTGGEVAWVYRHFPIVSRHPKAVTQAEASECAAELGGNQAFWDFADELYRTTPGNNQFDLTKLPEIATSVGLDEGAFNECLESGRYREKVQRQYEEVVAAGGRGTPHNVVIVGDQQAPIEGAQPIEVMRRVIETLLDDSGAQSIPAVPIQ